MTKRQLQAAIEAARAGRRRAWLPADLKAAVGAYCAEQRAAGVGWRELAVELSVGETQLRRWSTVRSSRVSKLQCVQVVAAAGAPATLCLELPGAARVSGLSVADLAALLRALQ